MKAVFEFCLISLDLSKSNTGVSTCLLDSSWSTRQVSFTSIFPDIHTYYGDLSSKDFQLLEVNQILSKIEAVIKENSQYKTFVIIENPIYHSFATELTYLIFQSTLSLCFKHNIDVLGVVPMTIKKFIGHIYSENLGKKHFKKGRVYDKTELKSMFKQLKDTTKYFDPYTFINQPSNDDERDSFYLLDYAISSFNLNYFNILKSQKINPVEYSSLSYLPKYENSFNQLFNNTSNDFFTLNDRKFYALRYLKKINFIE